MKLAQTILLAAAGVAVGYVVGKVIYERVPGLKKA